MIPITIKDKIYLLPTSYAETPFSAFIEVQNVHKQDIPKYRKSLLTLSVLTGCPFEDLTNTPFLELLEFIKLTDYLFETEDFEDVEPVAYVQDEAGNTYYVHDLNIAGEYICYEDIITKFLHNEYDGYPVQMAFLCRKEGESLDDIQNDATLLKERIEIMKKLATDTVFRVCTFFTKREESTQVFTKLSTEVQMIQDQLRTQIENDLAEYTAGTNPLSTLQVASLKLIRYSL